MDANFFRKWHIYLRKWWSEGLVIYRTLGIHYIAVGKGLQIARENRVEENITDSDKRKDNKQQYTSQVCKVRQKGNDTVQRVKQEQGVYLHRAILSYWDRKSESLVEHVDDTRCCSIHFLSAVWCGTLHETNKTDNSAKCGVIKNSIVYQCSWNIQIIQ